MITPSTTSRPLTTHELLAALHDDRVATLESLATSPFRITGDPIAAIEFWAMFDELVRLDGTVDMSVLQPADSGGMHFTDPVTVFVAVCVLLLGAFSAGYVAGKDAADTDDADDEAEAEDDAGTSDGAADRVGRVKGEQAIMTFAPGRRGLATRVVTTKLAPGPGDLSAKELLANLRNDRAATLKRLRRRRDWRVVTAPMSTDAIWTFVDSSVSLDGTIVLGAGQSAPPASSLAPSDPVAFTPVEIMILIALATLAAGALGYAVGHEANDNEAPGSGDDTETDQGDGSGGGNSDGGTGDDGGAGRGVVATPILRNGSVDTVDLTFLDASIDQRTTI